MFVDACAIVSLLTREETASAYRTALTAASEPFTSPLAAWEAILVLSRPGSLDCRFSEAATVVVEWMDMNGITLREPGDARDILAHAVAVAEQHGVGKRALSNFDCFHYAHAKVAETPLLTLDRLLRQTDVTVLP